MIEELCPDPLQDEHREQLFVDPFWTFPDVSVGELADELLGAQGPLFLGEWLDGNTE